MVSKISYFVIFGVIVFTNGIPAYRRDSLHGQPQYDLKKLLGELVKQGKYDVTLNHHEDRPGTHHEDITQLTYNGGKPNSRDYSDKYRYTDSHQGSSAKHLNYNSIPSQTSIQNLNLFLRNKLGTLKTVEENNNGKTNENVDDVLTFLNDRIDNTLNLNRGKNLELRCSGNRCGESRYEGGNSDRDESQNIIIDMVKNLRCNGKRCNIAIDMDRNDRNNLPCHGNRCSRSVSDRDDNDGDDRNDRVSDNGDILNILRCSGDKCGINRDDDDDDDDDDSEGIYTVRCSGDRCGINRDDDDDDDDKEGIYTLRCVGDRCGINRDDDDDDDDDDDRDGIDSFRCVGDRCGINRDGIDSLSCVGDRCGINRDGIDSLSCVGDLCTINRDDDDDDDDDDDIDTLRCTGKSCSRDRDDERDDGDNLRCLGDRCGRSRDDDKRDNLRCIGNRCGISRIDYENQDTNQEHEDDDEAEAIADKLLSKYANVRGNDYSIISGSDKTKVMKQVKSLLASLKSGLIQVVHGVTGLKPRPARPLNL